MALPPNIPNHAAFSPDSCRLVSILFVAHLSVLIFHDPVSVSLCPVFFLSLSRLFVVLSPLHIFLYLPTLSPFYPGPVCLIHFCPCPIFFHIFFVSYLVYLIFCLLSLPFLYLFYSFCPVSKISLSLSCLLNIPVPVLSHISTCPGPSVLSQDVYTLYTCCTLPDDSCPVFINLTSDHLCGYHHLDESFPVFILRNRNILENLP